MGVQREIALEAQEQMLAVGADLRDRAAGQTLGPAIHRVAALRSADLVGHLTLEHRPDPLGRVGDRVSLGHDNSLPGSAWDNRAATG